MNPVTVTMTTENCFPLPKLKEDIFIYKAKRIMQLIDHTSEDSLLLWLRLLLVTRSWSWIRHSYLGSLLGVG